MFSEEQDESQQEQLLQVDDTQRRVQIEVLDNEIEYNETLISEREDEIRGIEQGITELNEIFRDLGMLVNEQESGIRKYTSGLCEQPLSTFFYREYLWKRFKYITKYKASCGRTDSSKSPSKESKKKYVLLYAHYYNCSLCFSFNYRCCEIRIPYIKL